MSSGQGRPSAEPAIGESFDEVVLPHREAAYRLACWLLRNEDDAEDAVQEASLRAFRYFRTFTGGNGRAWFLRIVRNACADWRRHGDHAVTDLFDEEEHNAGCASDPEELLLQTDRSALIARAMRTLPDRFRDVLVGRELEGLSYRDLANVLELPMGTVMSRLSRARVALRGALACELNTRPRFAQPQLAGQSQCEKEGYKQW